MRIGVDRVGRLARAAERALRADRAAAPADAHRPRIAIVRERVEVPARRAAEHRHERILGEPRDLADRRDPPRRAACARSPARRPRAARPSSGWRKASSRSGGTTSSPSGFATPLATFARNFVLATPTVIGRPTRSSTFCFRRTAISAGVPGEPLACPRTSRNASSIESPSTSGVVSSNTAVHRLARLGVRGHPRPDHDRLRTEPARLTRRPSPSGCRTPSPRSSPRARRPAPTMTGRPRRRGSSRCSTDAKNASRSACRIVASPDTNICSHTLDKRLFL